MSTANKVAETVAQLPAIDAVKAKAEDVGQAVGAKVKAKTEEIVEDVVKTAAKNAVRDSLGMKRK